MTGRASGAGAIVRVVASAALVLYSVVAVGSGLDRLSVTSPTLERLVPGPLRAHADRSAGLTALARGQNTAALVFATNAVRRDPVDPLSNSLLGSALLYHGDPKAAEAAFRVAAARGWRDRLTQLYWYGKAIETGDIELAALRADAMLRTDPSFAAGALLDPLEADPRGRAVLARRLAEKPRWADSYLAVSRDLSPEKMRLKAQIVSLAAGQSGGRDCETPLPLVTALIDRGMRRDAESLWRAACGSAAGISASGLADGGFEQLAAENTSSPFGWRKHARGDVFIESVASAGNGYEVSLRNSASVNRLVLSQALALSPGQYRVRAKVGGTGKGAVTFSLDCGANAARPATAGGNAAAGQVLTVGACDSQVLGVWLRSGAGEVTIDDVAIEPLR